MKEEQLRILKAISEAKKSMDMTMFAQSVNLTADQTSEQIQELAKNGFLRKIGRGYGMSEKGKAALKASAYVPSEEAFHFYIAIDQPTSFKAKSIEEFYELVKLVNVNSLEFHLDREDFEKWITDVLKETEFADEMTKFRNAGLKGENLRSAILGYLEKKYYFGTQS